MRARPPAEKDAGEAVYVDSQRGKIRRCARFRQRQAGTGPSRKKMKCSKLHVIAQSSLTENFATKILHCAPPTTTVASLHYLWCKAGYCQKKFAVPPVQGPILLATIGLASKKRTTATRINFCSTDSTLDPLKLRSLHSLSQASALRSSQHSGRFLGCAIHSPGLAHQLPTK